MLTDEGNALSGGGAVAPLYLTDLVFFNAKLVRKDGLCFARSLPQFRDTLAK